MIQTSENQYDIIIVGAGASGLMAAVTAGEKGASVLLLEKMPQAGNKILITGNGRCNITNIASVADYFKRVYPNGRFLKKAFSAFFHNDIISFLKINGVEVKEEQNGKVYPVSDKAQDVLNVFIKKINQLNIKILYNTSVEKILTKENLVIGVKANVSGASMVLNSNAVIMCTGGKSYPSTGSSGEGYNLVARIGHTIKPLLPSMVPLCTIGFKTKALQGLSLRNVTASLWVDRKKVQKSTGEMLFTHFGLSGPLIHKMSRVAVIALEEKRKVELSIDLFPELDEAELDRKLIHHLDNFGKKKISNMLGDWLPSKLIPYVLKENAIDENKLCNQLNAKERQKLKLSFKDTRFVIDAHRGFKEAIVTAGGVSIDEIDSSKMSSKLYNNLYFAGEIIDVDGETGGYNLQIAFSTGYLAAVSAVAELL
ncbi:MAG: NAD(P)/FAD-dependent oxidoreductase [Bacteroidales bacterium]|nr:NAD(P)/FAD-dependent oxidoreductase [Bacteroidales bacterium]